MSRIAELGSDYTELLTILAQYDNELTSAKDKLTATGRLDVLIGKTSGYLHYYDQRKTELHTLVKFFQSEEARIRSCLFRSYKENFSRALNANEINKYIDGESTYINIHGLLLEVEEMYELYKVAVDSFMNRHYALSNITKLRVAQLEFTEI